MTYSWKSLRNLDSQKYIKSMQSIPESLQNKTTDIDIDTQSLEIQIILSFTRTMQLCIKKIRSILIKIIKEQKLQKQKFNQKFKKMIKILIKMLIIKPSFITFQEEAFYMGYTQIADYLVENIEKKCINLPEIQKLNELYHNYYFLQLHSQFGTIYSRQIQNMMKRLHKYLFKENY